MASHSFYPPDNDHLMAAPQAQRPATQSELSKALFDHSVQQPQDDDHEDEGIYVTAPTHRHFSVDQANTFPATGTFLRFPLMHIDDLTRASLGPSQPHYGGDMQFNQHAGYEPSNPSEGGLYFPPPPTTSAGSAAAVSNDPQPPVHIAQAPIKASEEQYSAAPSVAGSKRKEPSEAAGSQRRAQSSKKKTKVVVFDASHQRLLSYIHILRKLVKGKYYLLLDPEDLSTKGFKELDDGSVLVETFESVRDIVEELVSGVAKRNLFSTMYPNAPNPNDPNALRTQARIYLKTDSHLHVPITKHFKSLESRQAYLRSIDSTLASPEELQRQLGGRLPVIHFSHPGLMQATIETLLCFPIEALRAVFRSGIVFAFPHLFIVPATLMHLTLREWLQGRPGWNSVSPPLTERKARAAAFRIKRDKLLNVTIVTSVRGDEREVLQILSESACKTALLTAEEVEKDLRDYMDGEYNPYIPDGHLYLTT